MTADGEGYVPLSKAKEVVSVLKEFLRLSNEKEIEESKPKGKKKSAKVQGKSKPLPLGGDRGDNGQEGLLPNDKVLLQIDFKKIPLNKTVFRNELGPLPYPWLAETDGLDICLIVRDLDTKKSGRDRELDLETTRNHYKELLTAEGTGLSDEFIEKRFSIMPMREILTEYKEYDAKNKLAAAFDLFIADKSLMNNKFKELNSFLGSKFWVTHKKSPLPVDLSKRGDELGVEISSALEKTTLYVSGRGSTETVQIGLFKQSNSQLGYNLNFLLKEIKTMFGANVGTLRLKTTKSIGVPFYCDLASSNDIDSLDIGPQTRSLSEFKAITDDFPLMNKSNITVTAAGDVKITRKAKKDITEGDKDDDQFVAELEKNWARITGKKRHFPKTYLKPKRVEGGGRAGKRSKKSAAVAAEVESGGEDEINC